MTLGAGLVLEEFGELGLELVLLRGAGESVSADAKQAEGSSERMIEGRFEIVFDDKIGELGDVDQLDQRTAGERKALVPVGNGESLLQRGEPGAAAAEEDIPRERGDVVEILE